VWAQRGGGEGRRPRAHATATPLLSETKKKMVTTRVSTVAAARADWMDGSAIGFGLW